MLPGIPQPRGKQRRKLGILLLLKQASNNPIFSPSFNSSRWNLRAFWLVLSFLHCWFVIQNSWFQQVNLLYLILSSFQNLVCSFVSLFILFVLIIYAFVKNKFLYWRFRKLGRLMGISKLPSYLEVRNHSIHCLKCEIKTIRKKNNHFMTLPYSSTLPSPQLIFWCWPWRQTRNIALYSGKSRLPCPQHF